MAIDVSRIGNDAVPCPSSPWTLMTQENARDRFRDINSSTARTLSGPRELGTPH